MAKYQYHFTIDTLASSNESVIMTAKDGSCAVTILNTQQGPDLRVDWGNPSGFMQRAAVEQAVILGWS